MKKFLLYSALGLMLGACEAPSKPTSQPPPPSQTPANQNTAMTDARVTRSDQMNYSSDLQQDELTPINQSESEIDRTITQKIRKELVNDDNLSFDAKNIKVITINGNVTLRGLVDNSEEKNKIARKIHQIQGVKSVENRLEVERVKNL